MNLSSLDLMFCEPSTEKPVGPSVARIYVRTFSGNKKGDIFITSDCFSMIEFEKEINRLKQELETIRKKAKQKFPR